MLAAQPVDLRKSVHTLSALVSEALRANPYCGDVFIFRSKRLDRVKLLAWDGSGMEPPAAGQYSSRRHRQAFRVATNHPSNERHRDSRWQAKLDDGKRRKCPFCRTILPSRQKLV
jgi:IS66 Orf2 like protein